MRTTMRTTTVMLLSAGLLGLGAGAAAAEETAAAPPSSSAGQGFEPGPDYDAFQPGYAPGTADLVDDDAARVLTSVLRGLLG